MTSRLERPDAGTSKADGPLRVLFVVDGYYPTTGGTENQVRLLTRAFADVGHSVSVVAPRLDKAMPLEDQVDGIPVTRLDYPHVKLVGALLLAARYGVWLLARRREFDAIHVHMTKNLAAMTGILRPLLRATVLVKISGAWEFEGGILDPARRKRPLERLLNWGVRRVDGLQCISEFTGRMVREAGYADRAVYMIANAVDTARFAPSKRTARDPSAPVHVAYVGRIEPVKGVAVLVEAWSRIAKVANARLIVAGDGSSRAELMEAARRGGFADSMDFLGEITDVPSVLSTADVYVQPSYQEGLPNSVLEAMAMGLPIVATRVSGNEDVVSHEENGLLVPAGNAEELSKALLRLIEDLPLASRMGQRSREMIERRFGLPAIMAQLEAVYRGRATASGGARDQVR